MKNSKNIIVLLSILIGLSTTLMAKANIDNKGMKENIAKMAGEPGVFVKNEVFPKDYFLISKSLPFLVGLTLHHPRSSELGLSKEQIEKIQKIKGNTIPKVIKFAKEIKSLESALAKRIIEGTTVKAEFKAVDEIGEKKIALTKLHLMCIESVRAILTKEQRKILFSYASAKSNKKK